MNGANGIMQHDDAGRRERIGVDLRVELVIAEVVKIDVGVFRVIGNAAEAPQAPSSRHSR